MMKPTTNKVPLSVVSAGVVCSVGLTLPAFSAAFRASIANFQETHFWDEVHEPLVGAAVPSNALALEGDEGTIWGGDPKLARMFALAATECLESAREIDTARTVLVLLGPESHRPGVTEQGMQRRFAACEREIGRRFHAESRITRLGRPGLVEAIETARLLLARRDIDAVLVAGADTLLEPANLNDCLAEGRLRTSENKDGFIPGEAAACVLLTHLARAPRAPALSVLGAGMADEPNSWRSGLANTGVGLARAIRGALGEAGVPAHTIDRRFSDCSGESFFFDEAAYAWGRVLRAPSPPGHRQILVASSVGEVGTAAGPLMLALTLDAARRSATGDKTSLICLSCSGTARAALVTGNFHLPS